MPFYQQLQLLAEWLVISSLVWRLSRFRTEEYQIYLLCDWKWSCPAESGCCFRQPKAYCTVEDVPLLITFLCFLQRFYWREAGPRLGHDWALGRSQQSLTIKHCWTILPSLSLFTFPHCLVIENSNVYLQKEALCGSSLLSWLAYAYWLLTIKTYCPTSNKAADPVEGQCLSEAGHKERQTCWNQNI